jgi:hypothetical protein
LLHRRPARLSITRKATCIILGSVIKRRKLTASRRLTGVAIVVLTRTVSREMCRIMCILRQKDARGRRLESPGRVRRSVSSARVLLLEGPTGRIVVVVSEKSRGGAEPQPEAAHGARVRCRPGPGAEGGTVGGLPPAYCGADQSRANRRHGCWAAPLLIALKRSVPCVLRRAWHAGGTTCPHAAWMPRNSRPGWPYYGRGAMAPPPRPYRGRKTPVTLAAGTDGRRPCDALGTGHA